MMQNHKHSFFKELSFALLASALPVFFISYWLLQNNQLPISDAANYLSIAIKIYHHFVKEGFWSGLVNSYLERDWRPIFFPILAVPFMFFSKGNVYTAYSAVAISCILISTLYIYLLFRFELTRASAIVATNIVGLMHFIQANAFMFFSESALFPCVLGCTYHLLKSNYLRVTKHTYAFIFLFTLGLLLRPVELLFNLIFVLCFFIFSGWYKKFFSSQQILKMFLLITTAIFIFLAVAILMNLQVSLPIGTGEQNPIRLIDYLKDLNNFKLNIMLMDNGGPQDTKIKQFLLYLFKHVTFLSIFLVSVLGAIFLCKGIQKLYLQFKNRFVAKSLLIPSVIAILIIVLAWFIPFAFNTYEWIYRTSIGDVAGTGKLISPQLFAREAIENLFAFWGGELLVKGVLLFASLGIIVQLKEKNYKIFSSVLLYLLLIIPFPLIEVLFTIQASPRKLSIAFPALIMVFLILSLQPGRLPKCRVFLASILLCAQFCVTMLGAFGALPTYAAVSRLIGWQFLFRPITITPNPHQVVIQFLAEQAKQYHYQLVGIGVTTQSTKLIDPYLMTILAEASNQPFSITYPYVPIVSPDAPKKLQQRGFDAIFLYDEFSKMWMTEKAAKNYFEKYSKENFAPVKIIDQFLFHYANNSLAEIGWKLGPCIKVTSAELVEHRGCLLVKV